MKKKFISLLFVSLFTMSGCASEISPEKAEEVADDIKVYKYDPETISELKVQYKWSAHTEGNLDRKLNDYKKDESHSIELSSKFNYIHLKSKSSTKDKVESEETLHENESWFYMKNRMLFKAYRVKSKGNETKHYSKVEKYSDAINEFSSIFDSYLGGACELARGTVFLDTSIITDNISNLNENQIEYITKFYSSGSGNLRIAGAAKCEDYEFQGVPGKIVGALSASWNKYLLKSATLGITVNATDGTNKNDLKYTVSVTEKVSKLIIPTYPGLSSYANRE